MTPTQNAPMIADGFLLKSVNEMGQGGEPNGDWLWRGYLKRRSMTLLTSQWKTGKTTLMSILLSKLGRGGEFLGQPLQAGRAAVISEEAEENWLERAGKLSFEPGIRWICRPFRGRPRPDEWHALIQFLMRTHRESGLDLVVVDPLASFLPGRTENDAGTMLDVLLPLQPLTCAGPSVLLLHHPRKGESAPGQAARGSGALTGHVDIIVEMAAQVSVDLDDRRRRLQSFSRHDQTPRRLLIELNADKTDYAVLGEFQPDDFDGGWPVLLGVLEDSKYKLTRRRIQDRWPADFQKPSEATLWRWLGRAMKDGRVLLEGTGRRHSPFKYWLPGQEEKWEKDPTRLPDLPPLEPLDINPMELMRAAENVLKHDIRIKMEEKKKREQRRLRSR